MMSNEVNEKLKRYTQHVTLRHTKEKVRGKELKSGVGRRKRMKHGRGMEDREERSKGIEILIADARHYLE